MPRKAAPPSDPMPSGLRALVAPPEGLSGDRQEARAQATATLFLAAIPIGWVCSLLWVATRAAATSPAETSVVIIANIALALGYALSRTTFFAQGAAMTVCLVLACLWTMALAEAEAAGFHTRVHLTVCGLVLGAAVLSGRAMGLIALLNLAVAVTVMGLRQDVLLSDGATSLVLLIFVGGLGSMTAWLNDRSDASMRKQSAELRDTRSLLRRSETHDELTGLPNRSLFADRLQQQLTQSRRRKHHHFAVLFLDLDHFKVVNDSLGHHVGDLLLKEVAKRLKECVRPGDTVARLGGDEFIILLADLAEPEDAREIADRIQESLDHPFRLQKNVVKTSASLGIATGQESYDQAEELLRDADIAMYRAKEGGRSQTMEFDSSMRRRAVVRLGTEVGLRNALKLGELAVFYQPIVSLGRREVVACEALVRWQHPDVGMIGPDQFIEVAEETGLIEPLGEWVLGQACRDAVNWPKSVGLHVNLSPRQFRQPQLAERLASIVEGAGLEPERLTLELTEGVLMNDPEYARKVVDGLRDRGMHIDIDDFGTGYSSLAYLHQFPIDGVKVDRSFVAELGERDSVIRAVVALCHELDLRLTAEGIETEAQLIRLLSLDCARGQGFLFGKPRAGAEVGKVLRTTRSSGEYVARLKSQPIVDLP